MKRVVGILVVTLLWGGEGILVKVDGTKGGIVEPPVPKGVTGYVICNYLNRGIICGMAMSLGDGRVTFKVFDSLKNRAMALPIVLPQKGDKIIFGKDYRRVLILAPNSNTYFQLVNRYQKEGNKVISSDLLALFMEEEEDIPTREDLINLAKKLNIGRYVILTNRGIVELDGLSLQPIRILKWDGGKISYKIPFFTSYSNWESVDENFLNRYKEELKLNNLKR